MYAVILQESAQSSGAETAYKGCGVCGILFIIVIASILIPVWFIVKYYTKKKAASDAIKEKKDANYRKMRLYRLKDELRNKLRPLLIAELGRDLDKDEFKIFEQHIAITAENQIDSVMAREQDKHLKNELQRMGLMDSHGNLSRIDGMNYDGEIADALHHQNHLLAEISRKFNKS